MQSIDWNEFERVLLEQTTELLQSFSSIHPDEEFYAFCFDCNAVYGGVSPCLNSEAGLLVHYEESKQGKFGRPTSESFEEFTQRRRWNSGDWVYQLLEAHTPVQGEIYDSAIHELSELIVKCTSELSVDECMPVYRQFDESVRMVLYRMEKSGVFQHIKTTPDFIAFVIDHDEDEQEAIQKYRDFRDRQESDSSL